MYRNCIKKITKQVKTQPRMNWQILLPEYPTEPPEWALEDIRSMFFKCVKWQFEETRDPINCPHHYYCDSVYPGNYSPSVDILVLIFTTASYLATLTVMVMEISGRRQNCNLTMRYLLPSGPIFLPLTIFTLAKGYRINTIFPLSTAGPAILQLVHISAICLNTGALNDIKYVFLQASMASGILHASLCLDYILLPYYTGLDALTQSSFSGQCRSCVCRENTLIVGGTLVSYRGWSVTTFIVVGALIFRIICRGVEKKIGRKVLLIKSFLEGLGLVLISKDCIYLSKNPLPESTLLSTAVFGGNLVLISLHGIQKICSRVISLNTKCAKKIELAQRSN